MKSQKCFSLKVLFWDITSVVDPAKIHIITQIRIPSSQKEVCNFLGHASYYIRFIPNFTSLATPLFNLLSYEAKFKWDDECQISFEILK
jgi:hypothetical protein